MYGEKGGEPGEGKIAVQGNFANKDDWCTPALVDGFEKGMKAAGKSLELFRYDAGHGFGNEQRASVHDRHCAELACGRATELFRKHLGRGRQRAQLAFCTELLYSAPTTTGLEDAIEKARQPPELRRAYAA